MKRFSDYLPSAAMTEALLKVRAAREELARVERNTRQPSVRTEGGEAEPEGGGQEEAGFCRCGEQEK